MIGTFEERLIDPGPLFLLRGEGGDRSVSWGHPWQIGSASYWVEATRTAVTNRGSSHRYRLGEDLREEVAACIIGGFGMPFELGLASYEALRANLLAVKDWPSAEEIEAVLREPQLVFGSMRKYRFPRQRAVRLAGALEYIRDVDTDRMPSRAMRDWLLGAPGVGMKTASWIVRNIRAADNVAILDIHVLRAGARAGIFPADATVQRHYRQLEDWFVEWARIGEISSADLDAVIWADQAYWARNP